MTDKKPQRWSAAARAMNHAASLWEILPKVISHQGDEDAIIFATKYVEARKEAEKAIKKFDELMPKNKIDKVTLVLMFKVRASEELMKRAKYLLDELGMRG